jgi:hypothetical protein
MWLCEPPRTSIPSGVFRHHQELLATFGGIVERANEPMSWLLNSDQSLTAGEAAHDASFLDDYRWMMDGAEWPINSPEYYSICREANGNTTLCHRSTGEVLLFAPDHDFGHVVALSGCPEFSLYVIPSAPDFVAWVEAVADQWLRAVS